MDLSKLCRGCMKEVASWEKENFDTRAIEMFCFCTNIRITEEDRLPKQFCYDCIIKMESSYTFITEAQKVNVTLKNMISRTHTVIVEPDRVKNSHVESNIKLTLPDYKICSVIENDMRQFLDPIQNVPEVEQDDILEETPEHHDIPEDSKNTDILLKKITEIDERKEKEKEAFSHVCLVCKKSFVSRAWYEKHIENKTCLKMKYVCAHCPKRFLRESQLTAHSVAHSFERGFPCTTCGKKFKRRKQLAVHTQAHGEERPYTCDECSARFKTKGILKSHLVMHVKDKPFLCCFCGWSFKQAGNLTVHMRTHTGEKPFKCSVVGCGFRCSAASSLRRHHRMHTDMRPHVCVRCGKGFYDTSNLARHMLTHTGELPYPCPRCSARFSDSWKRKAHLMRAHRLALRDIPRMRAARAGPAP